MAKEDGVVFEHEKLGQLTFKKDKNGKPIYDSNNIRKILLSGIGYLVEQKLLNEKDYERFNDIINNLEIGFKENLPARTSMPYKYNRHTGEVVEISFYISDISLYIPADEMIDSIVDNLCQIIVMYKFPKDKLRELDKYGLDSTLNDHGSYWMKFAKALLPEDSIEYYKIAYKARDYILKNSTTEHDRILSNELGDSWVSEIASEYAERLTEEEMTEKDYPIRDFLEDKLSECEENVEENEDADNYEDDSDIDFQSVSPVSLKEYITNMEEKYEDELKAIGQDLVMVSSYQRGPALYDTIHSCRHKELKYYLFYSYWDWVDAGHELYTPELVSKWLSAANVQINLSELTIDENGFIIVYRGENEYSLPWKKGALSWTTSKEIAEKFAMGVRLRIQTSAKPKLIVAKVHKDNILARIDDRDEFELLCRNVVFQEEIKLKSNNKDGAKRAKLPSYVQE